MQSLWYQVHSRLISVVKIIIVTRCSLNIHSKVISEHQIFMCKPFSIHSFSRFPKILFLVHESHRDALSNGIFCVNFNFLPFPSHLRYRHETFEFLFFVIFWTWWNQKFFSKSVFLSRTSNLIFKRRYLWTQLGWHAHFWNLYVSHPLPRFIQIWHAHDFRFGRFSAKSE